MSHKTIPETDALRIAMHSMRADAAQQVVLSENAKITEVLKRNGLEPPEKFLIVTDDGGSFPIGTVIDRATQRPIDAVTGVVDATTGTPMGTPMPGAPMPSAPAIARPSTEPPVKVSRQLRRAAARRP